MQIRYLRDIRTGNFVVSLPALNQRIIVLPGVMQRVLGTPAHAVLGSWTVTDMQAAELGFIPPQSQPVVLEIFNGPTIVLSEVSADDRQFVSA